MMLLQAESVEITKSGCHSVGSFQIDASPKAFAILSGLYPDKILAIIRELCTNALDSHIEAGTTYIPFKVHLPDSWDDSFWVEDFGTGISPEQIESVYRVYFRSTRNDSNDYTGALGLGSKSPFCYADGFTVTSYYGGMERTYLCYLDEDRCPDISFLSETPSDRRSGLKVSLSVKKEDWETFRSKAAKALEFFDCYSLEGPSEFSPISPRYNTFVRDWYAIRTPRTSKDCGVRIVQGPVAYPLNLRGCEDPVYTILSKLPLDVFVNIGEFPVSPTREELDYTKQCIAKILKTLAVIRDEILTEVETCLSSCSTDWERLAILRKLQVDPIYETVYRAFSKFFFSPSFRVDPQQWCVDLPLFEWNNLKFKTFDLDLKLRSFKQPISNLRFRGGTRKSEKSSLRLDPLNTAIVLQDHTSKGVLAIKQFAREKKVRVVVIYPNVVWINDSTSKTRFIESFQFLQELKTVLGTCGNPPLVKASDLVREYLQKSPEALRRPKVSCLKFNPSGYLKSLKWTPVEFTPETPAFFVGLDRYSSQPIPTDSLNTVISSLRRLKLIEGPLDIYGIPRSQVKNAKINPNWIPFFKHFREKLLEKFEPIRALYQLQKEVQYIPREHHKFLNSKASQGLLPSPLKSYFDELRKVKDFGFESFGTWAELVEKFQLDSEKSPATLPDPEIESYPLIPKFLKLAVRSWDGLSEEDFQDLVTYHNLLVSSGGSNGN